MRPRNQGFTLIEVLVALVFVAIALMAIHYSLAQAIDTTASLRDRNFALWVAQNRLAEHVLQQDWPSADTKDGTADMAGREWRWEEQVTNTELKDLRRIEISVRAVRDDHVLARLVGLLRRPPPPPTDTGSPQP